MARIGVSVSEAARQLGIAHSALRYAERRGRITFNPDRSVNVALVRKPLQKNTDPSRQNNNGRMKNPPSLSSRGIAAHREMQAEYQSKMARLDYEKEARLLVSRDAVRKAVFDSVRRVRDQLMSIPDRIDSIVAAETNERRCNRIIADEIERALNELAGIDV